MDSPQYYIGIKGFVFLLILVLNLIINGQSSILKSIGVVGGIAQVLNLIINGQSSILILDLMKYNHILDSFKPYYKWIVLNTKFNRTKSLPNRSFKPYYKWIVLNTNNNTKSYIKNLSVLNLIINGQSSIQSLVDFFDPEFLEF